MVNVSTINTTAITPASVASFLSSAGIERVKISERAPAIRVDRSTRARVRGAAVATVDVVSAT